MRSKKKKIIIVLLIIVLCFLLYLLYIQTEENIKTKKIIQAEQQKLKILNLAKNSYNDFVKITDGANLYKKTNNIYEVSSVVHGNIETKLDPNYEIKDEFLKLQDKDLYVHYHNIEKIEKLTELKNEYKYYQNYIPWNEKITLKDGANLYIDDNNYYEVNKEEYQIIIKDDDKYGINYNNRLVYVKKEDVEKIEQTDNIKEEITDGIAVLNYHYTVSSTNENGELTECRHSICITDTMFDSHIKYLKENNFYGATLRDLELYIDGKIRLPKKTVVVTIDDGWYVARSITILEKYQIQATLFLIGSLASPSAYASPYLEIHSHTWDMHKIGDCPSTKGHGGGILCLSEETVLNDLKKSRENLDNTPYFCYPFYEYNQRAINLLKKAGFTMAFAGEENNNKVKVGQNKFKIPRYVIVNNTSMNNFIWMVN